MAGFKENYKQITTEAIAAAAFITPGTIISCAISGASFGYAMMWAILLAMLMNILMQEMYLRMGIVTGKTLLQNLRSMISNQIIAGIIAGVVIFIAFCSAVTYIGGNIAAIQIGFTYFFPKINILYFIIGCSVLLLLISSFNLNGKIETIIVIGLVVLSCVFLLSAFTGKPNPFYLVKGIFWPLLQSEDSTWRCVLSIIGATVLPYQLYLAASAADRWNKEEQLTTARLNMLWTIVLGGIISGAVVICGSFAFSHANESVGVQADSLYLMVENFVGNASAPVFYIALCFSGFSSAMLIAINFTSLFSNTLSNHPTLKRISFRTITYLLILVGAFIGFVGSRNPIGMIIMMQVFNVALLPLGCMILIYVMNHEELDVHKNSAFENVLLVIVTSICFVVSYQAICLILEQFEPLAIRLLNLFPFLPFF